MPELPEVEITRRGVVPHLAGQTIRRVIVRVPKLRWPVPPEIARLKNRRVISVGRRAKYLLVELAGGHIIIHLGMTGSIRVLPAPRPAAKHDHIDVHLANGKVLRYTDPRRFGCWLWSETADHKLFANFGPEPLTARFSAKYLFEKSRKKTTPVKPWLMDCRVVVGVGNIYASESLFRAQISPKRRARTLTLADCQRLATAIKQVLRQSIKHGGTTIRDFLGAEGQPGYYARKLKVYDHAGEPCPRCGATIKKITQTQRSTFYCPKCQR
ncbi:MAG: bifunctional DNA-formamidopyrimidine glycosylase/DNA-(apurinic or apyrimidinic site) lyase [Verrucomicrobiales bacterium]|jgi:formamidopyrimidine-DNA glycosylase|nr:bifunctional DNA-formamidopyrimidine glycosylase/DNA-(apurinic or apyrimidinic site) lyase [Verrucomicrobiales bacterium]